ncbi:MAG: hypothetical protein K2I03_01940 [Lachnospiraceae bacterium]|nr:hypothetical protein [Lachnospiraceae bacterium]MDE6232094.1 hypothetical protein [Lachnospiraceae bacterium]MDE6253529.1 hypothetical protein [Lachnospiraceae bacterium]
MQKTDIVEIEGEKIWDINEIEIDKQLSVKGKLDDFVNDIKETSLTHLNNGYVVRVHFSDKNYSATDALKDYLKQISQLQF